MEKQESVKTLQNIISELLDHFGVSAVVDINYDEENELFTVSLDVSDNAGVLIGRKGENLHALQSVVGMIYKSKTGDWLKLSIDVNEWKAKEQQKLEELAVETAERAVESGEPQRLYNLSPSQRRIVHVKLSEMKNITTESSGEAEERYLEVIPQDK